MVKGNALGDYLRSRRQQIRPEDVGLIAGSRRRVAGLRREELALLAGISSDYYLRLEQGRDTNPSPQVLDALARALQLDINGTEYLYRLANPGVIRWESSELEQVADGLDELIDQFPMPAFVANRYQVVLAANDLACALAPGFRPGQNILAWRLLDPAAKDFFVDWDEATEIAVGGLREVTGDHPDDPYLQRMVSELSAASARFRELWGRADVGYRPGVTHVRHSVVGELFLHRNRLNLPHSGGQHVITFRADPGSASAKALEGLRGL
jgi:transcriptional regulator with XRE-family HTH domain